MWNVVIAPLQMLAWFLPCKTTSISRINECVCVCVCNGNSAKIHAQVWTSHPSRIGCKQVCCSSRWAVSTILRQECDNLLHKSSWRLKQGLEDYSPSCIHLFSKWVSIVWLCICLLLNSTKSSRNSPFIIKVSLPHCLLEVRHSGLIKRGQSAGREK